MQELADWIFLTTMTNPIISGLLLVVIIVWAFELMTGSKHRVTSWLLKLPLHVLRKVIELPVKFFKWLVSFISRRATTTHRRTSPGKSSKDKETE